MRQHQQLCYTEKRAGSDQQWISDQIRRSFRDWTLHRDGYRISAPAFAYHRCKRGACADEREDGHSPKQPPNTNMETSAAARTTGSECFRWSTVNQKSDLPGTGVFAQYKVEYQQRCQTALQRGRAERTTIQRNGRIEIKMNKSAIGYAPKMSTVLSAAATIHVDAQRPVKNRVSIFKA